MKKHEINLFWYKHSIGHGNFGDEASPYIIEKLSGQKVNHFNIEYITESKCLNIKILLKNLWIEKISFSEFCKYIAHRFFGVHKVIMSIGSILVFKEDKNVIVWGSGILNRSTKFGNAHFAAVRGYRTVDKLTDLGYNAPTTVGDPGLLLPRLYTPESTKKFKLGIIPHFVHYEELSALGDDSILVINLCDRVEDVIDMIASCQYTISTSLHGLIVSHAYQIPSLWIDFEGGDKLAGDNIKFDDYFSSVEITPYLPYIVSTENFNLTNILDLFEDKNQYAPEDDIIENIQDELIAVAPFSVLKKYRG